MPSSRGSSQPSDWTQVSCTTGGFFTVWATRGRQRILQWVAYPFSRGTSWPRNRTRVSYIADGVFTNCAIREAHLLHHDALSSIISRTITAWSNANAYFQCLVHSIYTTNISWIDGYMMDMFSSVTQSWTVAHHASLSITNSWSSPKFMSIESVMPSNHLILCCPLFFLPSIFPKIRIFFQWVRSSHQVAKVLEFQIQHQSFQWTLRTDLL